MTIRKRGNSWQIIIDVGRDPKTGERQRLYETVKGRKKEAELRQAELLQELRVNNFQYVKPARITLEKQLRKYLDLARNQVARNTWERYCDIVENHLVPAIGQVYLPDLTPHMIRSYYDYALREGRRDGKAGGLSPTTLRQHHAVLRSALQAAVEDKAITYNAATSVKPPRLEHKEMKFLSAEELSRLLSYLEETGSVIYTPTYIAASTGARLSEVLGLKWQDVDLKNGTITFQRGLFRSEKTKELYFGDVKTSGSRRQIALTEEDLTFFKDLRQRQRQQKMKNRKDYADQDLVCARDLGEPMVPITVASRFRRTARVLDLEVSFHALRHTHATILLQNGAANKFVSARLGHHSSSFTEDQYVHRTMNDDRSIAKIFRGALDAEKSAE